MTEAIGPSTADVARALMAARQASPRSTAAAPQGTGPAGISGRSGNEGDSVTLSKAAQRALNLPIADGAELKLIPISSLRKITPQGLRNDAEAGLQRIMAELGITEDIEFSIEVAEDGAISVDSSGPGAEELEAAINADADLRRTFRVLKMISKLAYHTPLLSEALKSSETPRTEAFAAADAARERLQAARYTLTMTDGVLTTAFVDPTGERFGGVAPESEERVAIWASNLPEEGAPQTPDN